MQGLIITHTYLLKHVHTHTYMHIQSLGQLGVVLRVMPSNDVRVATCGKKWTMNSLCLVPAPDETPPLIIDGTHMCVCILCACAALSYRHRLTSWQASSKMCAFSHTYCTCSIHTHVADDNVDFETKMRLMSLSHAMDPDVLVIAAAAADVNTMRSFLSGAPDKVKVIHVYMYMIMKTLHYIPRPSYILPVSYTHLTLPTNREV